MATLNYATQNDRTKFSKNIDNKPSVTRIRHLVTKPFRLDENKLKYIWTMRDRLTPWEIGFIESIYGKIGWYISAQQFSKVNSIYDKLVRCVDTIE